MFFMSMKKLEKLHFRNTFQLLMVDRLPVSQTSVIVLLILGEPED